MWFARVWSPAATLVIRTGEHPLLYTHDTLKALASAPRGAAAKATGELGFTPPANRDTVTDLYAYFDTAGMLAASAARRRGRGSPAA